MKKLALITALLLLYVPAHAGTNPYVAGAGGAAAATCEVSATGPKQETQNDGATFGTTTQSQKLKISSSITVCKTDVFFGTGTSGQCKVQFWTDNAKVGSQIGGDSDTQTCSGWPVTFTWATNMPNLTSDAYMHIVIVSGTQNAIGLNTSVTSYEDTNYDFVRDGSDMDKDMVFRVYTYH